MGINIENAKKFTDTAESILEKLKVKQDYFSSEKYYEFEKQIANLKKNIKAAQDESRLLSIGIVGAVKAGKSSFLNACIFDGENILPKAATPMTAALTKITYSDSPEVIIHFYEYDDWIRIKELAAKYDEILNEKYEEYCHENIKNRVSNAVNTVMGKTTQEKSKEEYEKYLLKTNGFPEYVKASKETLKSVRDERIFNKLGTAYTIKASMENIRAKLNDYVGAVGRYTPIVSYVEFKITNKNVEGLEIIDTPGLNDPIVSRSMITKDFLNRCDAVLLLSPCSQFMQTDTINLMTNSLPSAGVKEIKVVGTKFDSGMMDKRGEDFMYVWKSSEANYRRQLSSNLERVKVNSYTNRINISAEDDVLFSSSICYSIYKKLKAGKMLEQDENKVYTIFKNGFKNYIDKPATMLNLSGINNVLDCLSELQENKFRIIESKNNDLVSDCRIALITILDQIYGDVISNRSKLENNSIEELEKQEESILHDIDNSKERLRHIFAMGAYNSESHAKDIENQILGYINLYHKIETGQQDRSEEMIFKTGLFGLIRKHEMVTYKDTIAGTGEVIYNIDAYIKKCNSILNKQFNYFVKKDSLKKEVRNVFIEAFKNIEYDERDILEPVDEIFAKISIPQIVVENKTYIDKINSSFPEGKAVNEDIHRLAALQANLLNNIFDNVKGELWKNVNEIKKTLREQSGTFADKVKDKVGVNLETLKAQMSDRKKNIKIYNEFSKEIGVYKNELNSFK